MKLYEFTLCVDLSVEQEQGIPKDNPACDEAVEGYLKQVERQTKPALADLVGDLTALGFIVSVSE